MALNDNALVSLPAAKDFLGAGLGSSDDQRIEAAINRASDLIEGYCNRPLKESTHTNLRLRGPAGCHLFLRHIPIKTSDTVSVTVDTIAQTVWRSESDGDPALFQVIVARSGDDESLTPDHLYRSCGWAPYYYPLSPYNVVVTYTGGFATIPSDLEEAALEVFKKVWNDQSKGLQDVTTVNLVGGGITLFDRSLPSRATEILDGYKLMKVA